MAINGAHEYPSILTVFRSLLSDLNLEPPEDIQIIGNDPVSCSPHRIGDATAVALATLATTLKAVWHLRTEIQEPASIPVQSTIAQLMAVYLTTVNDVSCTQLLPEINMFQWSDFYQCKDGRWVFLLSTYPHLRDINCKVLDCRFDKDELIKAVAKWNGFELEKIIGDCGGTCVVVRSYEEWITSAQGSLLVDTPVISIEKLSDSAPEPMTKLAEMDISTGLPLEGIKILDNTHVIAGPMSSRIAAEHGARVLTMTSPEHMDPVAMTVETGLGKQSAWCNLNEPAAREKFWTVLKDADVYVCSYLSLDKKGFSPQDLTKHRPGLIFVDFHCWGKEGPWVNRGGFDQLACSASGFSLGEGQSQGRPSLPPTHLLNDYLAAILGAAGMIEALRRRAVEGGSWRVHINLSRICMWVQSMGLFTTNEYEGIPKPEVGALRDTAGLKTVSGKYGLTQYLPTQIQFGGSIKPHFRNGAEPAGASPFAW